MADIISRLKLESGEFDSKIKRAGQELIAYSEHCRKTGLQMGFANKDARDFAQSLGNMQTTSTTARGKISELSDAFVNLRMMYKQMTDEEKNNQFGKNLAASLDQLKTRINVAKADLADVTAELNDTGQSANQSSGFLEGLASKFTINVDALKLFNGGLTAAKAALDVAKDAFMSSEANVDEWGRVVDSSKSLYEGFLTALNTGDISGYLGRIDQIVTAARQAYDELDRLGTMRTIQAPKMSAQQTENERMRMMIQTGRYIAPVDGRRASMKDGQLLTPDQIRRIEAQLQNGMKSVVTLVGNEVRQTGKAIDAVYNRQAQELGMSLKEFRKGTSSMAEFDKRMAGYEQYQKWREQHTTIDMQSGREIVARGNPFEQFAKWGTFRVDGQRYNDLVRLIQQRDQQAGQAYSMQSQAYRTMNRAEGVTVSKLMRGGATGGGATGGRGSSGGMSIDDMLLSSFLKADRGINADSLRDTSTGPSKLWEMMRQEHYANLKPEQRMSRADFEEGRNRAKNEIENREGDKRDDPLKEAKKQNQYLEGIGSDISGVLSGLEKMGIEIPEGLSSVVGGIQTITGIISSILTLVGVISALTSVKSVPVFGWLLAQGGIAGELGGRRPIHAAGGTVVGNTYSGDQIPAMLNAGEVVLSKAQAGIIASDLEGGGMKNLKLDAVITGEQIRLVLNNNGRRTGRGEYVTSNRR